MATYYHGGDGGSTDDAAAVGSYYSYYSCLRDKNFDSVGTSKIVDTIGAGNACGLDQKAVFVS